MQRLPRFPAPARLTVAFIAGTLLTLSASVHASDGTWIRIPPPHRTQHVAIYDPVRGRMIVFGGNELGKLADVWSISLDGTPAWIQLKPTGTGPSARQGASAIYDPVRDRMLVFAGDDGIARNDVWALSLSDPPAWSLITASGAPPSARFGHQALYDPVRDRMVIYAGAVGGTPTNDVWQLALAGTPTWSPLLVSGPIPLSRYGHTVIYDPVRDRMVMFGGFDGSTYRNDAWSLDLASLAWSPLAPTGSPPAGRYYQAATYDAARDRMVVLSGTSPGSEYKDVWALSLAGTPAWSNLTPVVSPYLGRHGHSAICDPVHDRVLMFGGTNTFVLGDLWSLALGTMTWAPLGPTSLPPDARDGHSAIYDVTRDDILVFGGTHVGNPPFKDVWTLAGAGGPWNGWGSPSGLLPDGLSLHTAIRDPIRDRMVVFGGYDGSYAQNWTYALPLTGGTWALLNPTPPSSAPSARWRSTAIYDPIRDRMVVFGGYNSGESNDVWALALSGPPTWTHLTPSGPPPPIRSAHSAIYDPVRDRMVVFGGGTFFNDVWALDLTGGTSWSKILPAGTPPAGRMKHSAVYDPVRDRMVVFGGMTTVSDQSDVWALSFGASPTWTQLVPSGTPPAPRSGHTAVYDPARDRMVVFGGSTAGGYRGDAWALQFGDVVSAPTPVVASRLVLHGLRPNPAIGLLSVSFELPTGRPARLELFDVTGRRLVTRELEAPSAGAQHLELPEARGLAAGVYTLRLTQAGQVATVRGVVLR